MLKTIKTGVIAIVLVSATMVSQAQKKITEGSLVYGIEYKDAPPSAPNELKVKFNGDVSSLDMQAGPASINILLDLQTGKGLFLLDVPVAQMQKAAKLTKEDVDEQRASRAKPSDFKITNETQKLLGYNATKYTFKDDKGNTGEVWTTTDIDIPSNITTQDFKTVKGTVLKIKSDATTIVLKSIKEEKVGNLSTSDIPADYEEITFAELKAMQGGGK